jgi:hypothetical protein
MGKGIESNQVFHSPVKDVTGAVFFSILGFIMVSIAAASMFLFSSS